MGGGVARKNIGRESNFMAVNFFLYYDLQFCFLTLSFVVVVVKFQLNLKRKVSLNLKH